MSGNSVNDAKANGCRTYRYFCITKGVLVAHQVIHPDAIGENPNEVAAVFGQGYPDSILMGIFEGEPQPSEITDDQAIYLAESFTANDIRSLAMYCGCLEEIEPARTIFFPYHDTGARSKEWTVMYEEPCSGNRGIHLTRVPVEFGRKEIGYFINGLERQDLSILAAFDRFIITQDELLSAEPAIYGNWVGRAKVKAFLSRLQEGCTVVTTNKTTGEKKIYLDDGRSQSPDVFFNSVSKSLGNNNLDYELFLGQSKDLDSMESSLIRVIY